MHVLGSIEADETAVQAIVREFHEETQIQATELYNAQFLETFYEDSTNRIELIPVFALVCPPNQIVILNDEHGGSVLTSWFYLKDLSTSALVIAKLCCLQC